MAGPMLPKGVKETYYILYLHTTYKQSLQIKLKLMLVFNLGTENLLGETPQLKVQIDLIYFCLLNI